MQQREQRVSRQHGSLGLSAGKDGLRQPLGCRGRRLLCLFCVTSHHRDGLPHHHSWEFPLDELVFGAGVVLVAFLSARFVLPGFALLQP